MFIIYWWHIVWFANFISITLFLYKEGFIDFEHCILLTTINLLSNLPNWQGGIQRRAGVGGGSGGSGELILATMNY